MWRLAFNENEKSMTAAAHQRVNQTSGEYEYFTPPIIVDTARLVMGCIDLDPASSELANGIIQADKYFDEAADGLVQPWYGNVWMNHPFSRLNNPRWIDKLISEYETGEVKQACCITYVATSEVWFQPLLEQIQCFLFPRTNYILPDGTIKKSVTKGSVITYFGENTQRFRRLFSSLGTVK